MYRILITGSRNYEDKAFMRNILSQYVDYNIKPVLVHGAAKGADSLAAAVAKELGWNIEAHPADWDKYGKRAGYLRNAEMAELGADICLAFPIGESKGTRMMIDLAKKKNIPVRVFEQEQWLPNGLTY